MSWRCSDLKRRISDKNVREKEAIYKLKGHVERRKTVLISNFKGESNGALKIGKSEIRILVQKGITEIFLLCKK